MPNHANPTDVPVGQFVNWVQKAKPSEDRCPLHADSMFKRSSIVLLVVQALFHGVASEATTGHVSLLTINWLNPRVMLKLFS